MNAIWHEGTVSGTTATCVIKTKDHADLVNTYYQTHIYAYDYSDNTGFGATEKIYIECNHTLGAWSVIKKATCTNTGIKRATCTKCNTTVSESIAATGHSYSNWTTTQMQHVRRTECLLVPAATVAGKKQNLLLLSDILIRDG